MPRTTNSDQLHGALDMLVLKVLENGPVHGYAIAVRLERMSNDVLSVEEGSLYPALYRMEQRGWLASAWALTDTGQRARFYKFTKTGRAQLQAETASWLRLTTAVADVLTIGNTIRSSGKAPRQWQFVGVVPDMRPGGPQGRMEPEMCVLPDPNQADASFEAMAMVMRLREDASVSLDRLEQNAEAVGPRVLVGRVRPAEAILSQQGTRPRNRMLLLTLLGAFGLLLTLVGIFSMTAYAVARRTREIGCASPSAPVPGRLSES